MLERFLKSINPFNLRELVFELIGDKYTNDDIASVLDVPAWQPIDDALCDLATRIREKHPERRLSAVLSVVAPQSIDLGMVNLGTLFSKFREEGSIGLQHFVNYLPPVSFITGPYRARAYHVFHPRDCTPQICPCLRCRGSSDTVKLDLFVPFLD